MQRERKGEGEEVTEVCLVQFEFLIKYEEKVWEEVGTCNNYNRVSKYKRYPINYFSVN